MVMVSLRSNRKLNRSWYQGLWYRCDRLEHAFVWRTLGLGNFVKCFNHCLIGHTNKSMEGSGAKTDMSCGGLVQDVSEEKRLLQTARVIFR